MEKFSIGNFLWVKTNYDAIFIFYALNHPLPPPQIRSTREDKLNRLGFNEADVCALCRQASVSVAWLGGLVGGG